MKTRFYDQIMPQDECEAIRRSYEQSIVAENVTFSRKSEHNFTVSRYSAAAPEPASCGHILVKARYIVSGK